MRSLLIIICISVAATAFAQPGEGGLQAMELEIINPLKVTLPRAERNFNKVPAQPVEPITPPIEYSYSLLSFAAPPYSPGIRPLRIKPPESTPALSNFVSAGFGNFVSPYLKGYLSFFPTKRPETGGLSFFHNSFGTGPVDGGNSAGGNTSVSAHIKTANNQVASEFMAGYEGRTTHFYGYTPNPNSDQFSVKQAYRTFFVSSKFSNAKKQDFNYDLKTSFSYISDSFEARESDLSLSLNTYYSMKGANLILVQSSYSLLARKDVEAVPSPRHLFKITPQYQFSPVDKLTLRAGVTVAYENDSIGKKNFHLFPSVLATYALGKRASAFASLSGDVEKVSLHSLSAENIWIGPTINIFHTNKPIDFNAGLNVDLGSGFGFNTGFGFARLNNFYVFKNSETDVAKFITEYDDIVRSTLYGAINFDKGNYSFRLRGDYFNYNTDTLQYAWHRPRYKVDSYVVIKAGTKLVLVPRLMVLGGMRAFDVEEANPVIDIKTAVDLSANLEYNFNTKAGLFLRLNNLLNREYNLYHRYPVRGIQGVLGFTYRF